MTEESLFEMARHMPEAERAGLLDCECKGDDELRRRVEALLAHAGAGSFLEKPALTTGFQGGADAPGERAGDRIGPYKLLEKIGEGGMGEVWVAEQAEPIRRRVALKLIKAGMDSRQVLARFEAERQALALMDHPNIAKVLDAGTTAGGRPCFVMEMVNGTPITAFCDARKLSPRERLGLFVAACAALQHAHMKGVIHRDVKPSNVLVALYDDVPVVKVIDFGVAKAVEVNCARESRYALMQAHYYVGLSRLARGDRDGARRAFAACEQPWAFDLSVFSAARTFLTRLKNDANWPAWVVPMPRQGQEKP